MKSHGFDLFTETSGAPELVDEEILSSNKKSTTKYWFRVLDRIVESLCFLSFVFFVFQFMGLKQNMYFEESNKIIHNLSFFSIVFALFVRFITRKERT